VLTGVRHRSPAASTTPSKTQTSRSQPLTTAALQITLESTFATVRLRTRVTKGPGSRAAGVAMAYKLIEAAQTRWRMVNAPHLVALVRNGAVFHKGKLLERPVDITPTARAESGETEIA
jgi:putative transposase